MRNIYIYFRCVLTNANTKNRIGKAFDHETKKKQEKNKTELK